MCPPVRWWLLQVKSGDEAGARQVLIERASVKEALERTASKVVIQVHDLAIWQHSIIVQHTITHGARLLLQHNANVVLCDLGHGSRL